MDHQDIKLCRIIAMNCRTSYREISEKLGLSVNAVHKRVQRMEEAGTIRGFTANISAQALGLVPVLIYGHSSSKNIDTVKEKIGKHKNTLSISIAGGNYLFITGLLENLACLDEYVSFVNMLAGIDEPMVGIMPLPPSMAKCDHSFTKSDYRIMKSLHSDARKPATEVARELGMNPRTVKKRLSTMIEGSAIELTTNFMTMSSSDIFGIVICSIIPGKNRSGIIGIVFEKCEEYLTKPIVPSNLPNVLILTTWTNTMLELRSLHEKLEAEKLFDSILVNVLYNVQIYSTWRDELLDEKAGE